MARLVWAFAAVVALAFGSIPLAAVADDLIVMPATLTSEIAAKRQAYADLRDAARQPRLTTDLLTRYVARQQALKSFDFGVSAPTTAISEQVLLGYIAGQRSQALDAIAAADLGDDELRLTPAVLSAYVEEGFVPTAKKVKLAEGEKECLAQAIYHEARGEPRDGQLAVANVIINRAMSGRYPSSICGVVFQNADRGLYRCQFTFACDGRSDTATERAAWSRSLRLAEQAFYEYQQGRRPEIVPDSTLYYHTTAVAPSWSNAFRRVASIGAHIFYSR